MHTHSEICCSSCGVSKPQPALGGGLTCESAESAQPLYLLNSAWTGPEGSDPKGRLGSKRKIGASPDTRAARRRKQKEKRQVTKAADRSRASEIVRFKTPEGEVMAGRGVMFCGWTQIKTQETRLVRIEDPEEGNQVYFRGLQSCGLRWVCPVCSAKLSEISRKQLNDGLAVARELGYYPVLTTMTVRHDRKMSLKKFWKKLRKAEYNLKKSRAWKNLNDKNGSMKGGFAKAVEITFSELNGWHPHFHFVMVFEAEGESHAIELAESLRKEWLHQLERVGLDGTSKAAKKHAFDVRGAAEVGNYVTKWAAAEELTLGVAKEAKSDKGLTPWQLLRFSRTAGSERKRNRCADLWWDFIQCFKGVHQLQQSPKFRKLVKAYEEPPADAEADKPEIEIYNFGRPNESDEWELVRSKRLLMIRAAEQGDPFEAAAAVTAVIASDATDYDLFKADTEAEREVDVVEDFNDSRIRGQPPPH